MNECNGLVRDWVGAGGRGRSGFLGHIQRMLACLLALAIGAGAARAQTAPAGNAHPDVQEVSDFGGVNPLAPKAGEAPAKAMDVRAKAAFSKQVDLGPLRDLAVFHNGRVKILDTLARETVSTITGRNDYFDYIIVGDAATGDTAAKRVRFDPLFTYLDMMIDPDFYASRPLIGVEFLPLREAFLKKLYTSESEIEWWKRDGRLKPADVARVWEAIVKEEGFNSSARQSLNRMQVAIDLYQNSWHNLLMKAPDAEDRPWQHIAAVTGPGAAAVRELAAGWRAGDASRVNAASKVLAAELPRINSAYYPTSKRTMERLYNSSHPFEWGFWMYALALVTLLLAFGTGRKWLIAGGVAALGVALGLHAFGFAARSIIAERFAIQNQFESMTGLSLFAVTVGTVIMLARRQWLFGAAAAGVGFMVLVTATQAGIPGMAIDREAPILNTSVLLKYHVTTVLLSYGLISLGFLVSVFYLVTHYAAKLRAAPAGTAMVSTPDGGTVAVSAAAVGLGEGDAPAGGAARVLSDLDKAQMIVLQLAFWLLGVGILLGAWWADHSWGRWWGFDPKELWALVTWIVYLVVIHLRFTTGRNRALVTAWLSVLGFFVMLWTYFGVNLLLPGLHAYA